MLELCDNHVMGDEKVRRVSFGEVLSYYMWLHDFTQSKVAELMGVSQNTVSRWVGQAHPPPQPHYVERLAQILHVDPDDLRGGIIRTGGGQEQSEHDQLVAMAARRARTPEELERMVATIEITLNLNSTGVLKMEDMARVVMQAYGTRQDPEEEEGNEEVDLKVSQ